MSDKKRNISLVPFIQKHYEELLELLNCINVGIYITDGQGFTLLVNDESLKTGGLAREKLLGQNMRDLVKEGFIKESASLKVIASGHTENLIQELGYGGQVFISGTPSIKNGVTELVVCTERDITETMNLKKTLEEKDIIAKKYENELKYLRKQSSLIEKGIIAQSKIMNDIFELALKISKWDATVLITGESGTGKEILANYIYQNSIRNEGPYIKVNCSTIPENLTESEFFGYERGAFTGANKDGKLGLFELADGGTIFLDEIGELPLNIQSKLLRVIQEKEFVRIGGEKIIRTDIRIITATNVDLKKAVSLGKFREDLYYRLNVIPIEIPPLRKRKEDIIQIALSTIDQFNLKYKQNKVINKEALQSLVNYDWPGNIRELKNLLERIIITMDGDEINENQIYSLILNDFELLKPENANEESSLKVQIERFEKKLISDTLAECETAYEASKRLKVNKSTISKKIRKYGLVKPNVL